MLASVMGRRHADVETRLKSKIQKGFGVGLLQNGTRGTAKDSNPSGLSAVKCNVREKLHEHARTLTEVSLFASTETFAQRYASRSEVMWKEPF